MEAAAGAGAHALKLQTYTADTITLDVSEAEFFIEDKNSLWAGKSLYELYQEAYTPWDWHEPIMKRANDLGMLCFSTPFDDTAVDFLRRRHAERARVCGLEVDDAVREVIRERGYGDFFVHRTGHSIDSRLHGSGPILDNLESRDDRTLVPGGGFSVEPGVYLPGRFGVRSEINVHWGVSGPEVTPRSPQSEMLLLTER